MVHMLVAVGAILLGSLFFSVVFRRNLEECIPPTIFGIILVLYLFYCADKLYLGYNFTLLLLVAAGAYSLLRIIKLKEIKPCAGRAVTQGVAIFLVFCLGIYLFTRGNVVHNWDDLRLWGAVPKLMYYDGGLQLGADSAVFFTMQSYYPGMQLFAFFITKTMGRFYEGGVYLAYGIFVSAMTVGVFARSKKRFNLVTLPVAVMLMWLPMIFFNNLPDAAVFYRSLYIDPILGITCGYVFYLIACDVNKDLFSKIRFCLALGGMLLLKDSALLFGVMGIVCVAVVEILKIRELSSLEEKRSQGKTSLLWLGAMVSTVALAVLPWKIQLWRFDVNTHIGLQAPKVENYGVIIKKFLQSLLGCPLIEQSTQTGISQYFTYAVFMAAFVIIGFLAYKGTDKANKRTFAVAATGALITNVAFVGGLCYMYMGLGWEEFASEQRYIGTVMLGTLTFFVLCLAGQWLSQKPKSKNTLISILTVVCVFYLPFNPIPQSFSPWMEDEYLWQATKANEDRIVAGVDLSAAKGEKPRVNFVMKGENGYSILHHTLYFALLDNDIQITFQPLAENLRPFYTRPEAQQREYNKKWLLGADYLYIFDYDDKFKENFGEYMEQGTDDISESSLYKINEQPGGKVQLAKVNIP